MWEMRVIILHRLSATQLVRLWLPLVVVSGHYTPFNNHNLIHLSWTMTARETHEGRTEDWARSRTIQRYKFCFTAQKRSVCIGPVDSLTAYCYLRWRQQREPLTLEISSLSYKTRSANDAAYQHIIQPVQETRQLSICAVWMHEAWINCGHADLLCAANPPS